MATKLRRRRIELELNQAQFANILGVGQPSISHWENGRNKPLGFPIKRKLEAVTGLSLAVLLENDNDAAKGDAAIQSGSSTDNDRYSQV